MQKRSLILLVLLLAWSGLCGCAENARYEPPPAVGAGTITLVVANNEIAADLHIKIDKKEADVIRGPASLLELTNPPRNEKFVRKFKLTSGTYHSVELECPSKKWRWKQDIYFDGGRAQSITIYESAVIRTRFPEPANADEVITAYFDAFDAEYERLRGTRRVKEQLPL